MRDLNLIPGLREPLGGPVRNVLGEAIGASDPLGSPLGLPGPAPRLASGMPAITGAIVHDVLGNPVAEVGMCGTLQPPPFGR